MKAISLWQPWASAIALGLKTIETRSWYTDHRGYFAIHAARRKDAGAHFVFEKIGECYPEFDRAFIAAGLASFMELPFGAIIATADLRDVIPVEHQAIQYAKAKEGTLERELGDYRPGRWAWVLADVRRLEKPIPFSGRQGFFEVPDD